MKAIDVAAVAQKSVGVVITRALLVTVGKMAVTAGVSIGVNKGVTALVNKTTGDPYLAKIVGTVSAIAAAAITSFALNYVDSKLGLSYNRNDYLRYASIKNKLKIAKSFESGDVANESNARKGNYGEMKSEIQSQKRCPIRLEEQTAMLWREPHGKNARSL